MEFIEGYRDANAPARSAPAATTSTDTSVRDTSSKEDALCKDDRTSPEQIESTRITSGTTPGRIAASSTIEMDQRHAAPDMMPVGSVITTQEDGTAAATSGLNQSTASLMGDAPPCDGCGAITVRNGTCYKCMNCGNSMGCS